MDLQFEPPGVLARRDHDRGGVHGLDGGHHLEAQGQSAAVCRCEKPLGQAGRFWIGLRLEMGPGLDERLIDLLGGLLLLGAFFWVIVVVESFGQALRNRCFVSSTFQLK